MCGIAGFIDTDLKSMDGKSILEKMISSITHRGPDSSGIHVDKNHGVFFGHRRLSIIDLTNTGHQPMISSDGRWVITFNGEIYNFQTLRKDLNKEFKVNWRGSSDTEVLLNAIQFYGIKEAILRSTGMFAFALWDTKKSKLYLARDRLGEKPLYYSLLNLQTNTKVIFGSELKVFKSHPCFKGDINYAAVYDFFKTMTINGSKSIFKEISKINPGEYIEIDFKNKNVNKTQYWSVNESLSGINQDYTSNIDLIGQLDSLLNNTIHNQMIADVKLGSFLSGGIDSSLVTSIMQNQSDRPISTFSIGFEDPKFNEATNAKRIASYLGTNHTEMILSPNQAINIIPNLVDIYDEPFADSSQIPTYLLATLARKHVKVVLSGDGGDEVFGGYNRHLFASHYWPYISKVPLSLRKQFALLLMKASNSKFGNFVSKSLSGRWYDLNSLMAKASNAIKFTNQEDLYLSMVSVAWQNDNLFNIDLEHNSVINKNKLDHNFSLLSYMQAMDLTNYLPNDILTKVDRASMNVSLETRIPFLDHKIVEFGLNLPDKLKIGKTNDDFSTKIILRKLLSKYIPDELTNKKKMGFAIPLASWIRGPLKEWAMDTLTIEASSNIGIFNHDVVEKCLNDHIKGVADNSSRIWTLLVFYDWYSRNL